MKLSITKGTFLDGLKDVQSVIPAKAVNQMMQNVLLEAADGKLVLTTTDLDMTVRREVKCEVEEPGATTLPAKTLFSAIAKATDGIVNVSADENDIAVVNAARSRYRFTGKPMVNFPRIALEEENYQYTVEKAVLHEMIRKVAYAVSQDETRRPLRGVLFSFKDQKLTMVATNGKRMAMVEQELEFPAGTDRDVIVPAKAINEINKSLEGEGEVKIVLRNTNIAFELEGMTIYSKLIDDKYPNYRLVIPTNVPNEVKLDRQEFINAIERVSVFGNDRSASLTFEGNTLFVRSSSSDIGELNDELSIKYLGEKIEVSFDPAYLLDPLKAIDDDEITIKMLDGSTAAVITCSIPFLYVIMPLRTIG